MSTIKEWPVLHAIKPNFALNIRNVFVFDEKAIFLITNDDCVYGFGENTKGCVGLGHTNRVTEPTVINELCGKSVINFQFGSNNSNTLALTKDGRIYSWGGNQYGVLANGSTTECYKPNIIEALNNLVIINIRCGAVFCTALSDNGKLYAWGYNCSGEVGIGNNNSPVLTPNQLTSLNDFKIIAVECGYNHSLALTDNGIVFVWGHNYYGQIGNGNRNDVYTPIKLNLVNNAVISKIRCGLCHSLLLSIDGEIYAFGYNQFGQIGDGSVQQKSVAVKLNMPFKCVDIAATHLNNISIAKLENGFCYVWGECDGQTISSPKVTNHKTINDVIINFSKFKWNYDQITNGLPVNSITKRFLASFNDEKYSDIAFKVDNKLIYVQKKYIVSVCIHFEAMFAENNWSENSVQEISITQYSYPVYYAFLKYLYTGLVEIETEHVFDLLDLANSYFEEEIKLKCAEIIKREICAENVCTFYSLAAKYELRELMECCFSFALKNIATVIETDGFKQSKDILLIKAIVRSLVQKN